MTNFMHSGKSLATNALISVDEYTHLVMYILILYFPRIIYFYAFGICDLGERQIGSVCVPNVQKF